MTTHRQLLATVRDETARRTAWGEPGGASKAAQAKLAANVRREMIAAVLDEDDARCADSASHGKLLWAVIMPSRKLARHYRAPPRRLRSFEPGRASL